MKTFYYTLSLLIIGMMPLFAQSLVINEIITSNNAVNRDDDGSYEDWVELYNGTSAGINLSGYGLTDNANLFKWVFPAKVIQPGEHLLIWCSEKNRTDITAPLHSNFKISADGETITLTRPDGVIADSYPAIVIPQNYTYGRTTDGASTFVIFPQPTPGAANTTTGYSEILSAPDFSAAAGFYSNSFNLTLSSTVSGVSILYTLDGSEPDENNLNGTTYHYKNQYPQNPGDAFGSFLTNSFTTYQYTGAINIYDRSNSANKVSAMSTTCDFFPAYIPQSPVPKAIVVRAKAIKPGAMASNVITKNYFITPAGANWFSLPVVALNTNEDKLFEYQNGIQVAGTDFDQWRQSAPDDESTFAPGNYTRSGDETEIKGNFSYFTNGQEVLNQDIGVRIHGGFTTRFPNKSFRLYARSEYGSSSFDYPFFEDSNFSSFERLILRNSGNDYNWTYFLDAFIHKNVKHLNFATQAYQPAVTFLNGEYWGLLNIRERYDKKYFERVFNIDEDALDYIELNGMISLKEGSLDHYNALMGFLENNSLSNDDNYSYVTTQLDPVNFADYFITEIFINNTDWISNNVELFRKKTAVYEPNAPYGQDGRWRWILKDTDLSYFISYVNTNTLAFATDANGTGNNAPWATLVLRRMLENEGFKKYFISRFADLLNTTFLPERQESVFNELKADIAPEMPLHIERWGAMGSVATWNYICSIVMDYAHQRPDYQRQHIREKFGITGNVTATLNVSSESQGYIAINTIDITPQTPGVNENPYPWSGIYFSSVPVTLKAVALPGYVFSHWTGTSTSTEAEITIIPTADFAVTAHFIPADAVAVEEPLYFWMFNGNVTNDAPLTGMGATYVLTGSASVVYQSCLAGYPFTSSDANWRKASMERRNSPTALNYIPQANDNLAFADSDMKAIQIKQPFQNNGLENALIFNMPTSGYKNVKFAFAAKDEGAASGITIEYSLNAGTPQWITAGLSNSSLALTSNYQLFTVDFDGVNASDDKADFKIRLRFTGTNMAADDGNRVTFNNVSLSGTRVTAGIKNVKDMQVMVYPNPASDILNVEAAYKDMQYKLFTYDGKLVSEGVLQDNKINMGNLSQGLYLLQLSSGDKNIVKKIIKK